MDEGPSMDALPPHDADAANGQETWATRLSRLKELHSQVQERDLIREEDSRQLDAMIAYVERDVTIQDGMCRLSERPAKAASRASRAERPCLRQVEQTERMRQNASAPASLQNVPDTFCWTLTMRRSRSA